MMKTQTGQVQSVQAQITSPSNITAPSDITTDIPNIEIAGIIDNPDGNTIEINNNSVTVNADGTFTMPFGPNIGYNYINIKLTDALGDQISKNISINLTSLGTINAPNTITVRTPKIKIGGTIDNPAGYTIRINGVDIPITNNQFESIQNLQWGYNYINIVVVNPFGQMLSKDIIATYDPSGGKVNATNIAVNPVTKEVYAIDSISYPQRITKILSDGAVDTAYTLPDGFYSNAIAFSPSGEIYAGKFR